MDSMNRGCQLHLDSLGVLSRGRGVKSLRSILGDACACTDIFSRDIRDPLSSEQSSAEVVTPSATTSAGKICPDCPGLAVRNRHKYGQNGAPYFCYAGQSIAPFAGIAARQTPPGGGNLYKPSSRMRAYGWIFAQPNSNQRFYSNGQSNRCPAKGVGGVKSLRSDAPNACAWIDFCVCKLKLRGIPQDGTFMTGQNRCPQQSRFQRDLAELPNNLSEPKPQGELVEPPVFVFNLFHPAHHGRVHAAVFGSPLVKGGAADANFTTKVRHRKIGFGALQSAHDLAVGKSRFLHVGLPSWKILLLRLVVFWGRLTSPRRPHRH